MSSTRPDPQFWSGTQVVVTGGGGFLGRPTVGMLEELGAEVRVTRSAEHDLRDRGACFEALEGAQVVMHLAANVGGIGYNRRNPGPLAHDNLAMGLNVFEASRELGVEKLVAACSVCAYPKFTPVPFREDSIWDGYPEESNAPYGLAKKMLLVLSDSYRRQYGLDSCAPVMANLYGPGDNFDLEDSHVIAAMIHKYVVAAERGDPEVVLWGTGEPSREFLYVDDAARALIISAERDRSGDPDQGPGRDDLRSRGIRGQDRLGRLATGRPAQALFGRHSRQGADRVRGGDAAGRGSEAHHRELQVGGAGCRRLDQLALDVAVDRLASTGMSSANSTSIAT
jgi:GDP-L-fucose synthase